MSNIKDARHVARPSFFVIGRPRARDPCDSRVVWFSISVHAGGSVPLVMVLRSAALWVAGAPLLA